MPNKYFQNFYGVVYFLLLPKHKQKGFYGKAVSFINDCLKYTVHRSNLNRMSSIVNTSINRLKTYKYIYVIIIPHYILLMNIKVDDIT